MDYTPRFTFDSQSKIMKTILPVLLFISFHLYAQNKPKVMEKNSDQKQPLVCKLTSMELQERKQTILAALTWQVLEKKEIKNGFQYKFEGSDSTIDQLTEFIKTERQCCNFFNFSLAIAGSEDGFTWLTIAGPSGAKEFIKEELGL